MGQPIKLNNQQFTVKSIILIGLLTSLTMGTAMAQTATLTVNVSGFKNAKGVAKYWLFNSADGFPTDEKKVVKCVEASITGTTSRYVFENLPAGTYAIGVIHDENGNHKFDTNFMGIPKEAYVTSNDVRGGISGPPKFEPAKFTLPRTGATLTLIMK